MTRIPIKLMSLNRTRGQHWSKVRKRAAQHRSDTYYALVEAHGTRCMRLTSTVTVTVTRVAPKPLDAHDNLPASAKHCVDGITDFLGLKDDSDPRITWVYKQSVGKRGEYAVTVEFTHP